MLGSKWTRSGLCALIFTTIALKESQKSHVLFIYEFFPPSVFVIKKIFRLCGDTLTLWWAEETPSLCYPWGMLCAAKDEDQILSCQRGWASLYGNANCSEGAPPHPKSKGPLLDQIVTISPEDSFLSQSLFG